MSHLILLAFCAKNFNLHFTEATCWVFLLILYDAAIIVAQCVHMYHIFKLGLIFLKQDTLWMEVYLNVQFQVEPKKISPKILELIPPRCVPSFKSLSKVFADICKCPISSQTIKYRYKFKSNQKILLTKNACMDPLKVCTKFQVSRTSLS